MVGQLVIMQFSVKAILVVGVISFFSSCVYLVLEDRVMSGGTIYRNLVWFAKGFREYTRYQLGAAD